MKQCSQGENPLLLLGLYPSSAEELCDKCFLQIIKNFSTNKRHHLGDNFHSNLIFISFKYIGSCEQGGNVLCSAQAEFFGFYIQSLGQQLTLLVKDKKVESPILFCFARVCLKMLLQPVTFSLCDSSTRCIEIIQSRSFQMSMGVALHFFPPNNNHLNNTYIYVEFLSFVLQQYLMIIRIWIFPFADMYEILRFEKVR